MPFTKLLDEFTSTCHVQYTEINLRKALTQKRQFCPFTPLQVVPNLYEFLSSEDILFRVALDLHSIFYHIMEFNGYCQLL